jgi:hypothetical protein
MSLVLLQSLSLPGQAAHPNEDAFGHGPRAALVMDGATMLGDALMPGPSDAAWISQFGVRRVLAHLECDPKSAERIGDAAATDCRKIARQNKNSEHDRDAKRRDHVLGDDMGARKALRAALDDTCKSFAALARVPPRHMWQMPCASMMLAVVHPSLSDADRVQAEFLWFGDCTALLVREGVPALMVGQAMRLRAAEADAARALAREKKFSPAAADVRDQLLPALRARRARINSDGNWLFSPDPKAAAHARRKVVEVPRGSHLLLATDGFLTLVSDYGAYDPDGLARAVPDKGLMALGTQIRAIEAGDKDGARFPRFKTSDDCTALWLRLD